MSTYYNPHPPFCTCGWCDFIASFSEFDDSIIEEWKKESKNCVPMSQAMREWCSQNITSINKSRIWTDEQKKAISDRMKGNKNTFGLKFTSETKAKMSASHTGKKNPTHSALMKSRDIKPPSWAGKKHSPETKAKMAEAAKRREAKKRLQASGEKSCHSCISSG